jgi:hypothetical protein
MTPAQLAAIARDNAKHYARLAEESAATAAQEADADIRRYLRDNAAFFTERAAIYAAQAATFTQGATTWTI